MSWDKISVKQFYEIQKAIKDYEDDFDRNIAIIGVCEGLTFDEALELKISEITKLSKQFGFLSEPIKTKLQTKWNDYTFTIKLSDLKAGQMIDFLETCKGGVDDKLHTVLAVLDTTSKKDFDNKEQDILNNCPVTIVKGISDFFFRKYNLSPQTTPKFSRFKLRLMMKNLSQI